MADRSVTVTAPVNIAVIKYWGKRDSKLNLPINSSLSATLDQQDLCTTTTVSFLPTGSSDKLELNGKQEDISNPRIQMVLKIMRDRAPSDLAALPLSIVSHNNFPTAAGLASSASGYCALVFALSKLYNIDGDVSAVARQGSGSATRSLYGGFVKWEMGEKDDGSDSIAVPIVDETHWPEVEILVLVVCVDKKKVGSTVGMQETVKTCPGIEERIKIVPSRMEAMEKAIKEKDFDNFAKLTMLDSDHFHELCHTTTPPIRYMNEVSDNIVQLVKHFNKDTVKAAYTFDAGPNAVIYIKRDAIPAFLSEVLHYFTPKESERATFFNKPDVLTPENEVSVIPTDSVQLMPETIQNVIHTKIGGAPRVIQ